MVNGLIGKKIAVFGLCNGDKDYQTGKWRCGHEHPYDRHFKDKAERYGIVEAVMPCYNSYYCTILFKYIDGPKVNFLDSVSFLTNDYGNYIIKVVE